MAINETRFGTLPLTMRRVLRDIIDNWFPSSTMSLTNKTISSCTISNAVTGDLTGSVKNAGGEYIVASGAAVPTGTGYAEGCVFSLTNATLGQAAQYVNAGTAAAACFVPSGPRNGGWGVIMAGGPQTSAGGDTTETISLPVMFHSTDLAIVEHGASNDSDTLASVLLAPLTGVITITASADPVATEHGYNYAVIRNNCPFPTWDIFAAGSHTTAGGAAAEAITVTGVAAGDIAFVTYGGTDDSDTIAKVVCSANTVTVTCSADPGEAHIIHYAVFRPAGSFKPSHKIAYAGTAASAGGDATEAITVTGAAATDIPIVLHNTSDDTDTIKKAVMTTNTLTLTVSADPGAGNHNYTYMILRACV